MIYLVRFLVILIVLEMVFGGIWIGRQLWRPAPPLPAVTLNDPLVMPRLRELADIAAQGTADDWAHLGEALLGRGFYSHAELAFREALKREPRHFMARFGLAFSLERTGRMQASTSEYAQLFQTPSKSPQQEFMKPHALYFMGRNSLRLEQAEAAEKQFRNIPNFPSADYQVAKLLIRSGRAEEALPIIEKNLEAIPYSLEFHFLHYRALQELGRQAEAFAAASMIERSAYLVSMNFNIDYLMPFHSGVGLTGKLDELRNSEASQNVARTAQLAEEVKSILGSTPLFEARVADGRLLEVALLQKQPEQVLEMLEQLRARGEESATMLEYEGDARQLLGDPDAAAICWNRALLLTPSISLHQKLADHYAEKNTEKNGAQNLAERNRHLGKLKLMQGIAEYRRNRLSAAIPLLQQSAELNPDDAVPWYYLGEMHFHLQQPEQAQSAFQRCLELHPGHGRAAAKLKFLSTNS